MNVLFNRKRINAKVGDRILAENSSKVYPSFYKFGETMIVVESHAKYVVALTVSGGIFPMVHEDYKIITAT
ncbi:hypothetical protein [Jeotgalibacillus marinus]|uniref:DUF2187 domain-containing protein n=1 Tax=Jeotgalibacillus marinus TaxID=86667 RepID=A0ABV3Q653_9BACL